MATTSRERYLQYVQAAKARLVNIELDVESLLYRYEKSKRAQAEFESKARIIEEHICPNFKRFTSFGVGEKFEITPFNAGAAEIFSKALRVASRLTANTCDKAVQWLGLDCDSMRCMFRNDTANVSKDWINIAREYCLNYLNNPLIDFYNVYGDIVMDMLLCGNCVYSFPFFKEKGKFDRVPLYQFSCSLHSDGSVKEIFRTIKLSAREAFEKFGMELPEDILRQAFSKGSEAEVEKDYLEVNFCLPAGVSQDGADWVITTLLPERKLILNQFTAHYPKYVFSRLFKEPCKVYGNMILFLGIPTIKIINDCSYRGFQSVNFASKPVTLTTPDCNIEDQDIRPGNILRILDPMNIGVAPIMETTLGAGRLDLMLPYIDKMLAFLDDLLDSRDMQINPVNMTATQVSSIQIATNERMRPFISRLEDEVLAPIVRNVLKSGLDEGRLPPFPFEELGIDPRFTPNPIDALGISFMGRAARMQRRHEVAENEDFMRNDVAICSQFNLEETLAAVDVHKFLVDAADKRCLDNSPVKSEDEFARTMQAINRAKEEEKSIRAMETYGRTAKDAGLNGKD